MDAFLGEIRAFPYQFCPQDWQECNGQQLQVQQFQALYAVIGNLYGGSPPETFSLPDLRGQAAMHFGTYINAQAKPPESASYAFAQKTGVDTVTLLNDQMEAHTHTLQTIPTQTRLTDPSSSALIGPPAFRLKAGNNYTYFLYSQAAADTTLAANSVSSVGSGTAHDNHQPFLVIRYCICVNGWWPPRPD
ncbi:phage tail protein [Ferrovibrio sp.]|uniref:phage tail protein n=1 Tax=Ferrovibrio sp. TaxID=1917215 RepID=UPI003D2E8BB7